jgi:hypothetical protein
MDSGPYVVLHQFDKAEESTSVCPLYLTLCLACLYSVGEDDRKLLDVKRRSRGMMSYVNLDD